MTLATKQQAAADTPLTAITGYKHNTQQLNNYIQAAWNTAYASLWNGQTFSLAETQAAKDKIKQWLLQQPDVAQAYSQMVQRILLTRLYLSNNCNCYAPIPTIWFDASNSTGYVGTERWMQQVQQIRMAKPLHQLSLKAFAEAVLEMQEEPTGKNFHYWRSYFTERNQQQMLNLFLSTIAWSKFSTHP